jgi:hypothetical protein
VSTDDDRALEERLRRTFARVAGSTPVPPAPALPEDRRVLPSRWRPAVLGGLAAAAALVVAVVIGVAVVDDSREGVQAGEGEGEGGASSTTVDEAGRVTAQGTDGDLVVTATIGPGAVPGLVAVDIEVHDDDGVVEAVAVRAPNLTPIDHEPERCTSDGRVPTDLGLGYSTAAAAAGPVDVEVVVTSVSCASADRDEVALDLHLPATDAYEGPDGPRSPLVRFALDDEGGIVVSADGIDGCLVEVLVDWDDPPAATRLEVPPAESCSGASAIDEVAASHDFEAGTYVVRVTASTEDQIAFMEREVVRSGG